MLKLLIPLLLIANGAFSQNIGIGTTTPTRAKLEVNGTVGYTTAIFGGETTGIGILQNNPGIGFNGYVSPTSYKYIANGYSGQIWLDAINGGMYFDVFGYGNANTIPAIGINSMRISSAGNVGIRTYQTLNASLFVVKADNSEGSAVFSGTSYASFFHNGTNEDTYIRGGKNASTVIINDIANGNIQMGNGSGKVGINTLPYAPATALEVNGAVSLRAKLENIVDNTTIVVGDRSFISIFNNIYPAIPRFSISDGINSGQILILSSDINNAFVGIDIADGPNIQLEGAGFRLQGEETLTLIWNGTKWLELCRSNNFTF